MQLIDILNLIGRFLCYFWLVFFAINIYFKIIGKTPSTTQEQDRVLLAVMVMSFFVGLSIFLATL